MGLSLPPLFEGFEVKNRAIQIACEGIYGKNCQEGNPYRTAYLLMTERQIDSISCNRTPGLLQCKVSVSTRVAALETESSTGGGGIAAMAAGGLLLAGGTAVVQPEIIIAGLAIFIAACPKSETIEAPTPSEDIFSVDDAFEFDVPIPLDKVGVDRLPGDDTKAAPEAGAETLPDAPPVDTLVDSGVDVLPQPDTPPQPDAPLVDAPPQVDTVSPETGTDASPDQVAPDAPVVEGDVAAVDGEIAPEDAVVLKEIPNYGKPDGKDDGWVSQFEGGAVLCFNTTASTCAEPKNQCWVVTKINDPGNPDLLAFVDPEMEYLDVTLDGGPYDKVEEGIFTLVDFGEVTGSGYYEFATWMSEDMLIIANNISGTVALNIIKGGKNVDFSSCDWNFSYPCMEEGGNPCE